jgi:hypothetical protein
LTRKDKAFLACPGACNLRRRNERTVLFTPKGNRYLKSFRMPVVTANWYRIASKNPAFAIHTCFGCIKAPVVRVEIHPAFSLELNGVCRAYQSSVNPPVKSSRGTIARVCAVWLRGRPSWFLRMWTINYRRTVPYKFNRDTPQLFAT